MGLWSCLHSCFKCVVVSLSCFHGVTLGVNRGSGQGDGLVATRRRLWQPGQRTASVLLLLLLVVEQRGQGPSGRLAAKDREPQAVPDARRPERLERLGASSHIVVSAAGETCGLSRCGAGRALLKAHDLGYVAPVLGDDPLAEHGVVCVLAIGKVSTPQDVLGQGLIERFRPFF